MAKGKPPCERHPKKSSQDFTNQRRCRECAAENTRIYRARCKAALKICKEMGIQLPV